MSSSFREQKPVLAKTSKHDIELAPIPITFSTDTSPVRFHNGFRNRQPQPRFIPDAQQLPFEEARFDVVIDESVMAFVADKQKAISEYIRVAKLGGYTGLNEVAWVKTPPSDLVRYITLIMAGADFLTSEGWTALLESSGLKELQVRRHKFDARRQWLDEMQQLDLKESFRAWYRFMTQSVTNPAYRKFTQEVLRVPRNIFKFMDYIGYGLYVGRK
ncbi:MAG: methyltransferase domain-containing protein [Chloroflexi bacterium]|nr:methyltransferase domain-containing protein [Chloroflexota bacterium]